MLDTTTKKRIDDCRDILVGKVPDPKSQIEQITVALIYKFMDDMDREAVELGGARRFFSGEFEQYAWPNLFAASLSGLDRVKLYGEAIDRMDENGNLPQLFRDIFKNAYLPYRDAETLREFLKYINEFHYSHSEKLGDAFEYLLSVLGSQGDAGQFRTPRHIIDFMAEVLDPQKNETIMDPACGTSGFLISAYKHILRANSDNYDDAVDACTFLQHYKAHSENPKRYTGDKLSPSQRLTLTGNIRGYDISPDMVRLSLVNLYLHGFAEPHIYEYDTLTQQDRWDETADVILANPPFMSPKGGIKPHNRFSVQSKRSEVLFVDYMAEHLSAKGRAMIIVPEGIIFQTGTAYKQLRKMLVQENYLVGVISLPAGVFNPYSGVKTSILWLDKTLAAKTDKLLFAKIENDGFDLGAQRREIKQNDLPELFRKICGYKNALRNDWEIEVDESTKNILLVEKKVVEGKGDFVLSGERYRAVNKNSSTEFDMIKVGELCSIVTGKKDVNQGNSNGSYPFFTCAKEHTFSDSYSFDTEALLIAGNGDVGSVNYFKGKFEAYQRTYVLKDFKNEIVLTSYLYALLNDRLKETVSKQKLGNTMPYIKLGMLTDFEIPLPPLEVQREIVAEITGYQKIIDGARQVVEHYKPRIDIDPAWPVVELGEVCDFKNGLNFSKDSQGELVKVIGVGDFQSNVYAPLDKLQELKIDGQLKDEYLLKEGDLLFVRSNGNQELVGRNIIIPKTDIRISFSGFTIRARFKVQVESLFYAFLLKSFHHKNLMMNIGRGANIRNLSQSLLERIEIPLPDLATQQAIVARIQHEQQLVQSTRELIALYEQKIKARIARVWGEPVQVVLSKPYEIENGEMSMAAEDEN